MFFTIKNVSLAWRRTEAVYRCLILGHIKRVEDTNSMIMMASTMIQVKSN